MYCSNCGQNNLENSKFCKSCGSKLGTINNEDTALNQNNVPLPGPQNKSKAGLTGWLALLGLGLIVSPIISAYNVITYVPFFEQEYEIPGLSTALLLEFSANLISVFGGVFLLYLYLKRKSKFPKYYILFFIFILLFTVVDLIVFSSLTTQTTEQQQIINDSINGAAGEMGKGLFFGVIWSLYLLKSKQVKATFVNN